MTEVLQMGRTLEEVQKQTRHYGRPVLFNEDTANSVVQKVTNARQMTNRNFMETSRKCYNCNRPGHIAKDVSKCAARNVTCFNCGMKGHFKACCRKRKHDEPKKFDMTSKRKVYAITESQPEEKEKAVFYVKEGNDSETLSFNVGGILTSMIVDSGSPANIIREDTYQKLRDQGANILNERNGDQIGVRYESFASNEKICFTKAFETEISIPGEEMGVWTHILVAPRGQTDLLSKSTAFALGVLKIGYNVNNIVNRSVEVESQQSEFPKVPDTLLKIKIDENVSPVIQPARRLPIAMEADVEKVIITNNSFNNSFM